MTNEQNTVYQILMAHDYNTCNNEKLTLSKQTKTIKT